MAVSLQFANEKSKLWALELVNRQYEFISSKMQDLRNKEIQREKGYHFKMRAAFSLLTLQAMVYELRQLAQIGQDFAEVIPLTESIESWAEKI